MVQCFLYFASCFGIHCISLSFVFSVFVTVFFAAMPFWRCTFWDRIVVIRLRCCIILFDMSFYPLSYSQMVLRMCWTCLKVHLSFQFLTWRNCVQLFVMDVYSSLWWTAWQKLQYIHSASSWNLTGYHRWGRIVNENVLRASIKCWRHGFSDVDFW